MEFIYLLAKLLVPVLAAFYVFNILVYYRGINSLVKQSQDPKHTISGQEPTVSVIVCAHNEELYISKCLDALIAQDYPEDRLEIVVINDASSDTTGPIIDDYAKDNSRVKSLHPQRKEPGRSNKKQAVTVGVLQAQGELIFTTDADCEMGPDWIKTMVSHFDEKTGMVIGLPVYKIGRKWHHSVQAISNAALISASFALLNKEFPVSCSAANMGYRKKVFNAVNGFAGIDQFESGDDDFLLQKIFYGTEWKIQPVIEPESFVYTQPESSLKHVMNQHSRWGSKGIQYQFSAINIYLTVIFLSLINFYSGFFLVPITGMITVWLIKLAADLLIGNKLVKLFHEKRFWRGFPAAYLGQPIWFIIAVIRGTLGWYKWK